MGVVQMLLEAGANPLLEDWNGYSAVTRADTDELRDMLQAAADKGGFKVPSEGSGDHKEL